MTDHDVWIKEWLYQLELNTMLESYLKNMMIQFEKKTVSWYPALRKNTMEQIFTDTNVVSCMSYRQLNIYYHCQH